MDVNAGNGRKNAVSSTTKSKEDESSKGGLDSESDDVDDSDDSVNMEEKLREVYRLKNYLDIFKSLLTTVKKLNDVIQLSEREDRDPLRIVGSLKDLLCDRDKQAGSGLDSSALCRKHCELIEKFMQLDKMVKIVEGTLSKKMTRSLTNVLEDFQNNMLKFKVGLMEFQRIAYMESGVESLVTLCGRMSRLNVELTEEHDRLMGEIESRNQYLDKYERKRTYSW